MLLCDRQRWLVALAPVDSDLKGQIVEIAGYTGHTVAYARDKFMMRITTFTRNAPEYLILPMQMDDKQDIMDNGIQLPDLREALGKDQYRDFDGQVSTTRDVGKREILLRHCSIADAA